MEKKTSFLLQLGSKVYAAEAKIFRLQDAPEVIVLNSGAKPLLLHGIIDSCLVIITKLHRAFDDASTYPGIYIVDKVFALRNWINLIQLQMTRDIVPNPILGNGQSLEECLISIHNCLDEISVLGHEISEYYVNNK